MRGLKFDFDIGDISIVDGEFETAVIDNQNIALIAISQVCRLTRPEVGAQLPARIANCKPYVINEVIRDARQQAKKDGATDVVVSISDRGVLTFSGTYED